LGLNISVRCTFGRDIPLLFYKYYAALPLRKFFATVGKDAVPRLTLQRHSGRTRLFVDKCLWKKPNIQRTLIFADKCLCKRPMVQSTITFVDIRMKKGPKVQRTKIFVEKCLWKRPKVQRTGIFVAKGK